MPSYTFLADALVIAHFAYVAFIVLGQAAILIGIARGWRWVRNPVFRIVHLLAIGIVAVEAMFQVDCPLTVWENHLRALAGEDVEAGTFLGRWAHDLLFFEAEAWVFNVLHIGFGVLVLVTFLLAPPRRVWPSRLSLT